MDVDFPLILSWAVIISGGIWLLDWAVLRPRRLAAVEGGTVEEATGEPIVVEYARSFFPVLLLVLVVRSFLAEPYQIPSESMVPQLQIGDFILVNKYAYGIRLPVLGTKIIDVGMPERGDVMVFIPPHDPRYFIKRVIGLPGDRIRYENKTLYVNGERANYEFVSEFEIRLPPTGNLVPVREYAESFGDGAAHAVYRYPHRENAAEWTVPAGEYFMMGDNRGRSEDSRSWGSADEDKIVGKAVAIWLHKEPGWHLPSFSRNTWFDNDEQD